MGVDNDDGIFVGVGAVEVVGQKLEKVAVGQGKSIRAGVRLTTDESGIWRKFGIPLSQLSRFFAEADKCRHVELSGLQFHLSWNLNPDKYVVFIVSLGSALRGLERSYRQAIKFLDIGGGYWPPQGEWLQAAATPEGVLRQTLLQTSGNTSDHYKYASVTIDDFANHIAQALKKQIPDDMSYTVYTEPGRWLSNEAMHILLRVELLPSAGEGDQLFNRVTLQFVADLPVQEIIRPILISDVEITTVHTPPTATPIPTATSRARPAGTATRTAWAVRPVQ